MASTYATCPPIMNKVNVEGVEWCDFECDTAASHNIMSGGLYKKLRQSRPDVIPELKPERLTIRLADGSISRKACGSIRVAVRSRSSEAVLNFFIMNGPNNLLGRLALEQLWPKQYGELKNAVKNMVVSVEVPEASSRKVYGVRVEADAQDGGGETTMVCSSDSSSNSGESPAPARKATMLPEKNTFPYSSRG